MAAGLGDLNGDGRLDLFVTNLATEFGLQESNFAWINNGKPLKPGAPAPFTDQSEKLGLARGGWGWDAKVGDFDNDGKPEIVQASGFIKGHINRWPELHELAFSNDNALKHVTSWPKIQPGADVSGGDRDDFWARGPSGRYANLGKKLGLSAPMVSRGVALADVNGDGRLDYGLANQWGTSYLYRNRAKAGPYLGLDLLLPPAGRTGATKLLSFPPRGVVARPAIGAEVTIALPSGRKLVQQVYGTNGHAGASAQQLLFGLGPNPPSQVVANVAWRDGAGVPHHASFKLRPGWHAVLLEER
jgi:enediyne biosynthesis protein E4